MIHIHHHPPATAGQRMAKEQKGHLRRWRIILARSKGVPLGTVEAASAKEAVEIGAKEFDCPAWRLIAEAME